MKSYESSHNNQRARRRTAQPPRSSRPSRTGRGTSARRASSAGTDATERDLRRAERMQRRAARSVGADALAAPSAQALGLVGRNAPRPRGRGETVRRVEQARAESYSARPAVYTAEPRAQAGLHVPSLSLPNFSVPVALIVVVLLAGSVAFLYGPMRNYYSAWRDSGILQVEYEVLASQNEDLSHELDRLQTLEGIEDEARSRGYVYPDEEALVVTGVEEQQLADPAAIDEAVAQHEQSLPWYVPLLDSVFGYEHE